MKRLHGAVVAALAAAVVGVTACQEVTPTALDDGRLPEEPLTVQVQLGWSEFGSDFQVYGGYGLPTSLGRPVVANTYEGSLEARSLLRFGAYPTTVQATDSTGVTRADTLLTFVGGVLTLAFDTLTHVSSGPVSLQLDALQEEWDSRSASWDFAVDSVGDERAWTQPGGGAVVPAGTSSWDASVSQNVDFALDSAAVADWMDVTDQSRGALVSATTDGVRLEMTSALLVVDIRPSLDPDSVIRDTVALIQQTFIYNPPPSAPTGIRVGGVPAWRTVMDIDLPPLSGPPELCAAVGCPYTLEPGHISYAGLVLTTKTPEAGYQPLDTMLLDVRPVLAPAALPRSPLGPSQTGGFGALIAPEAFGALAGSTIEVPITSFMRALLGPPGPAGLDPPSTLALLSLPEPVSLPFAAFDGPTEPGGPVLSLILTVGNPQVLP